MTESKIEDLNKKSNDRIKNDYSWENITSKYHRIFESQLTRGTGGSNGEH